MGQWRQAQADSQRFPRVTTAIPIRIATVDAETDPSTGRTFFRSAEETTANLSRGGACVRSWEPLAAGRTVVITIDLPSERGEAQALQLVGEVVWTRRGVKPSKSGALEPAGYGVEFVGGSRAELEALDRFLSGLEPKARVTRRADLSSNVPTP